MANNREGDMENVRYRMFACETCGATFHRQEREHGIGVEPDMSQINTDASRAVIFQSSSYPN